MVEYPTKTCSRCEADFDARQLYTEVLSVYHVHAEDAQGGNYAEHDSYILCEACLAEFKDWFDQDVDTYNELMERRAEENRDTFDDLE